MNHVYFTWPDDAFAYQCRGCGACCKGLGIGLDHAGGQVDRLVQLYPDITAFLRKRGATWTAFNPRGQCWFLDPDDLCRIHRDHGRDVKPASCRLFPFNRVFRLGRYTIVDYNSVICPLRVALDDPDAERVTHQAIVDDIAAIADPAVVGTELPADKPDDEGQRFVTRERKVARACFAAARSASPGVEDVWRAQGAEGTFERARVRASKALDTLTGQAWRAPTGSSLRAALWLTPSMRFNELYGPRSYDPRPERVQLLPALWLAWLHFVAIGAELAGRDLGLREATSLWSETMPLCYVVARFGLAPTMDAGPVELPGPADPDQVIKRLARACIDNRKQRRPLSALLSPLLDPYLGHERVVLARLIEPLLGPIRWRKPR